MIDLVEATAHAARPLDAADAVRRRPRRPDAGPGLPDVDDLRAERRRAVAQHRRAHRTGRHRRRRGRAAARPLGARRRLTPGPPGLSGSVGSEADRLVEELVGDDVLGRQALLRRRALLGVHRDRLLDQLGDAVHVEAAHHAVGAVGDELVLLHRRDAVLERALGVLPAEVAAEALDRGHDDLVRRGGLVEVVHAGLLDDRHQLLEAGRVRLDVLRLRGDRLGVVPPADVVDVLVGDRLLPALQLLLVQVRLGRAEALLGRLALVGDEQAGVTAVGAVHLLGGEDPGRHEVVHVRRAAEVADLHALLAEVGDALHVGVRCRVPHDHLRVLLEPGLDGDGGEVRGVLDRLVGVHVAEEDVVVLVHERRDRLEVLGAAAGLDADLDAGVVAARVDERTLDGGVVLVDGVALADHLVQEAVLGLRHPVGLDGDRGGAVLGEADGLAGGGGGGGRRGRVARRRLGGRRDGRRAGRRVGRVGVVAAAGRQGEDGDDREDEQLVAASVVHGGSLWWVHAADGGPCAGGSLRALPARFVPVADDELGDEAEDEEHGDAEERGDDQPAVHLRVAALLDKKFVRTCANGIF